MHGQLFKCATCNHSSTCIMRETGVGELQSEKTLLLHMPYREIVQTLEGGHVPINVAIFAFACCTRPEVAKTTRQPCSVCTPWPHGSFPQALGLSAAINVGSILSVFHGPESTVHYFAKIFTIAQSAQGAVERLPMR